MRHVRHQQPPCDYEEKVKKISEKLIQSPHSGEPLNQVWNDLFKIFLLYEKSEVKWSESRSVMSDSLRPLGLYSPWNSPGQDTGVGSLSLLQGIFPTQGSNPGLPHCRQTLYQLSHKGNYNCWNHIWLNIIGTCSWKYFNKESINLFSWRWLNNIISHICLLLFLKCRLMNHTFI